MVAARSAYQRDELPLNNDQIARRLEEIAGLLQAQDASLFRVRAYRMAAETLRRMDRTVVQVLDSAGLRGLLNLPGIGNLLGRSIEQLCRTGRLSLLQRLRGEGEPERFLRSVPGIGPSLAARINEQIETLEDLEEPPTSTG